MFRSQTNQERKHLPMDNLSQIAGGELATSPKDFESKMKEMMRSEVERITNSIMKAELSKSLGFEKNEQGKAKEAGDSRNGSYDRVVDTSFGPIKVSMPRDRNGDFESKVLPPYMRRTYEVEDLVLRLYRSGLSDQDCADITEALYSEKYSKSTISSITDVLEEDVKSYRERPIEGAWFAVFLDSTYVPLRRKTVQKEAINIAMGITMSGERKMLGYSITPQESAEEWGMLLDDFMKRGLKSAKIVVSDGLAGISSVLDSKLPGARHQRCFVHLARNLGAKVRKPDQAEIMQEFMDLSRKKGAEEAISAYSSFVKKWGLLYPSVRKWSEEISPDEIFAFYGFPEGLRTKIYTNNCIEGFNKQIKRMIKKHIQFVDEKAEEKVLVSIFLHYDEKVGKRKTRGWEMIEAMANKD